MDILSSLLPFPWYVTLPLLWYAIGWFVFVHEVRQDEDVTVEVLSYGLWVSLGGPLLLARTIQRKWSFVVLKKYDRPSNP